jgi:hypothetical protein
MVEDELEFARQAILSGKIPLKIKKYHRRRLFWVIICLFAGITLCMNFYGTLGWKFWEGAFVLWPVFLVLVAWRRSFATSPDRDFAVIVAELAIIGFAAVNGLTITGSPPANYLPPSLVQVAAAHNR